MVGNLESSNFNQYPHYVYATAFLVNGELADFKIGDRESDWGLRTFRGTPWENEVHFNDYELTCKYKKILVNNDEEHNKAFDTLEDWLFDTFKLYQKANLRRWR